MIRNAFTGESWTPPKSLAQQATDFTAEGAPAPGVIELKRQTQADEAAKALLRAPIAESATAGRARRVQRAESPAMSRLPTNGEVVALRVWMQELEDIQRKFSEQDRQRERPRIAAARSAPAAEIPHDDWDALFCAVKYRLRATVSKSPIPRFHCATAPWQASVLECVDALDKLQLALNQSLAAQGQIARGEPNCPQPSFRTSSPRSSSSISASI